MILCSVVQGPSAAVHWQREVGMWGCSCRRCCLVGHSIGKCQAFESDESSHKKPEQTPKQCVRLLLAVLKWDFATAIRIIRRALIVQAPSSFIKNKCISWQHTKSAFVKTGFGQMCKKKSTMTTRDKLWKGKTYLDTERWILFFCDCCLRWSVSGASSYLKSLVRARLYLSAWKIANKTDRISKNRP